MSPTAPVLDALNDLQVGGVMPPLQPHTHLEVLPLGLFGSSQHPANARRVSCHRLFHEDMFSLAHGFLEVNGSKPGRAGQNHHICQRDGFLVTLKIRELMLRGNRYLVFISNSHYGQDPGRTGGFRAL